jgi:DNA-binding NarL/FixJ family response regulator
MAVETEHRMPLSDRQRQILRLIAQGRRNGDIAESLFVSVETVRTHVKEILRRLGAHDRAHAVARGYEAGLLGKG